MSMHEFLRSCAHAGLSVSDTDIDSYNRDESRFSGSAEAVVKAGDEAHVVEALTFATRYRIPLTTAAARTSVTGAPVPEQGAVLDVNGLDAFDPRFPHEVGPGMITAFYRERVAQAGLFFPPDPTSAHSCTLGGNVACNASGALSYRYGPTRDYIDGLTVALPDGGLLHVKRGQTFSRAGSLLIPRDMITPRPPRDVRIPLPERPSTPWTVCKNAAGPQFSDPMDLIDLFIGSEGIFGVATHITTRLLPARSAHFALLIFLPEREAAIKLIEILINPRNYFGRVAEKPDRSTPECASENPAPSCMEWLGASALALVRPDAALSPCYGALYVEQEYSPDRGPEDGLEAWGKLLADTDKAIHTEAAMDEAGLRRMRKIREMVPERLNERIKPGLTKIGTDFAAPLGSLREFLALHDEFPAGCSYVFGHIGNIHLHANLLPESPEEAAAFKELTVGAARRVKAMGGTISAEHGIGKLKRKLFAELEPETVAAIRTIKRILDPGMILNRGNLIDPE